MVSGGTPLGSSAWRRSASAPTLPAPTSPRSSRLGGRIGIGGWRSRRASLGRSWGNSPRSCVSFSIRCWRAHRGAGTRGRGCGGGEQPSRGGPATRHVGRKGREARRPGHPRRLAASAIKAAMKPRLGVARGRRGAPTRRGPGVRVGVGVGVGVGAHGEVGVVALLAGGPRVAIFVGVRRGAVAVAPEMRPPNLTYSRPR